MSKSAKTTKRPKRRKASPLIVRLDSESKSFLAQAADLRRISVSDYVRSVTVAHARKEVAAARENIISLTPEQLGAIMRGLG
jgi:uncharacterized protein (DUF1778 family)